jgi:hypothetical protein
VDRYCRPRQATDGYGICALHAGNLRRNQTLIIRNLLLLSHCDCVCKIAPHCNAIRTLAVMLKMSCLGVMRFNCSNSKLIQVVVIFSELIGCLCLVLL